MPGRVGLGVVSMVDTERCKFPIAPLTNMDNASPAIASAAHSLTLRAHLPSTPFILAPTLLMITRWASTSQPLARAWISINPTGAQALSHFSTLMATVAPIQKMCACTTPATAIRLNARLAMILTVCHPAVQAVLTTPLFCEFPTRCRIRCCPGRDEKQKANRRKKTEHLSVLSLLPERR